MVQRPGRKIPMEQFHRVDLTEDQLNAVAYVLRTYQDIQHQERTTDPEVLETMAIIDEVMIAIDSTR